MSERYQTDYEAGQDNRQGWGMDIHHPVFLVAVFFILIMVVGTLLQPGPAMIVFNGAKAFAITYFDWLFMAGSNAFVLFCVAIALSRYGKIRLGGKDARPEFSNLSWRAMLFAAGMGIGLMFWSVAEPTAYYTGWSGTPLDVAPNTPQAADLALGATLFHWGLHAWAIYAVVGLSLAFFTFNKGLPLTVRSGFFPLIKDHAWGGFGHVIDVIAVLATLFGLATSLGFGAQQAASGFYYLFGIDPGLSTQIAIIAVVTLAAIVSVVRGLERGIKVLSNVTIGLAAGLLLFVIIAGPTAAIFSSIGTAALKYGQNFIALSNWVDRDNPLFFHDWTVFYWAWWISWSPFVGMFIARISKGRTVREFVVSVLLVPTLVTLVWMGAFGGTALEQVQSGMGALAGGITEVPLAMFQMLESLPLAQVSSFIAIVLVLIFFVTSSDSGSLVIDSITSGGKLNAPVPQRIFWAAMEGLVAAVLLFGGGDDALGALQAAAIIVGLPFTLVLLIMCVGLYKGLAHEWRYVHRPELTAS